MIVNEFPPTGESGVQRPLKFVKYLSRMNWETHIITPNKPPKNVIDKTLVQEIPSDAKIYETRSLGIKGKSIDTIEEIRFNLNKNVNPLKRIVWNLLKLLNDIIFPLDKQIGWVPFALFRAIKVINRYNIRNVYITAFPYSAFLIGIALKRIYGKSIYWVADYRDAWQFEPVLDKNVLGFRKKLINYFDDLVLKTCDKAVFTTEFVRSRYIQKHSYLESKACVITNGYDEDDFLDIHPHQFDRFTFLYMGKIYSFKANPIPALEAVKKSNITDCQYIHIGTISAEIKAEIDKRNYNFFSYHGYKPHSEAIDYAAGADVNLIIQNDDDESQGVFLAKIFELLRIGKPILYIGPRNSIIKDLIYETKTGVAAYISDQSDIVEKINYLVCHPLNQITDLSSINRFSRTELTKQLISLYASME